MAAMAARPETQGGVKNTWTGVKITIIFFFYCVCVGVCVCVTERERAIKRWKERGREIITYLSSLHFCILSFLTVKKKKKQQKRDPSRFASVFVKWREKHIIKLHGLAVWSQAQTTPVMHKSIARKANWATFNKHKTGRGYLIINSWSKKKKSRMRTDVKPHLKDMHTKNTLSHTHKKNPPPPFYIFMEKKVLIWCLNIIRENRFYVASRRGWVSRSLETHAVEK